MAELLEANWVLLIVALVIGVLVAWWVFAASRRTKVQSEEKPQGGAPAKRNQALIDSPQSAPREEAAPPPAPDAIGGTGVAVSAAAASLAQEGSEGVQLAEGASPGPTSAAANTQQVAAAPADADAEAGSGIPAREAMKQVPAAVAHHPHSGDELTRLKGVGPKLAARLGELGVTRFSQIAAWEESDIDRIDPQLGRFQGRIRRDDWVGQARMLAAGDTASYEERFGKI